jgi:ABC-2 type transport system permease protein
VLCGLLADRSDMAPPLEIVSHALPLTYAYEALRAVADRPGVSGSLVLDLGITVGMMVLALAAGAVTLRRRTP